VYYIKRFFLQQIAKYKLITFILHKAWVIYLVFRSKYLYFLFFKLKKKINSLSDRGQDKWIIDIFDLKKRKYKGFFLEIGGGDGFSNSNSFILENYHDWSGILIEPDPDQFKLLKINRPKTLSSNKLIYDKTTKLNFLKDGELSKIIIEDNKINRKNIINIETITLNNLLSKFKAPKIIDFFSLDVEGSEDKVLIEDVLKNYIFLSLCIERPSSKLHNLLSRYNYVFIRSNLYDYFYINKKFNNFEKLYLNKKKFTGFYNTK
jgi:FkbM family methyltransferase